MLRTAKAFAPGHLTGLFQICDQPADPVLKGSRGSGVSINLGVYSLVSAEPADSTSWSISINGKYTEKAYVSEYVLNKLKPHMNEPMKITVDHILETPLGSGFGSSGGGALTLSLAANKVMNTGLSELEAQQLAHVADIECKTGLGSVAAAIRGGFGVTYKPGGPGVSEAQLYKGSSAFRVIYQYFAPIETKAALSDPAIRKKINEIGGRFCDELNEELTVPRFMKRSRSFAEHVGLATPRLKKIFEAGDKMGITFTMAMFGEVAFTIIEKERVDEALDILMEIDPNCEPVLVGIENEGARLV
ncbi:MAG: hypothetical protein NTV15_03875 [Candidatus Bathyarchaeota archaeon]|nr:hypothetical protein [Candidatus Bathyarchaeota archaeon]